MFPTLLKFGKNTKNRKKSKDMVFIKIYDMNGHEKEKYKLTEDDYFEYFSIMEALCSNIEVEAKIARKTGEISKEDEELFKKIDKAIEKSNNIIEKARSVNLVKILCFEGEHKEEDFINIKIFRRGEKIPEETYIIKYSEVKGYIEIINSISSKLEKIAKLNPISAIKSKIKKKDAETGNKFIKKIIKRLNYIARIEVLILRE